MKQILLLATLLFTFNTKAQSVGNFTGVEKAYMYHMVMKSPILKLNIGRYFEYSGPKIFLRDTIVNYDSTELLIINQPELLYIRKSEIAKASPGIIAELANKMALWELNKSLLAYQNPKNETLNRFQKKFESFKAILLQKLPSNALETGENGAITFKKKVMKVLNPSLNFDSKTAMLGSLHFLNVSEQKQCLIAVNESINEWVGKRTADIFSHLGGKSTHFENFLIAAGDGSNTSGMLNEREKDEKGRWNRGLPKAVGLFPYQFHLQNMENSQQKEFEPERFAIIKSKTIGNNRQTNIHADVWGYNDKKQTTVVIEKKGKSYILFGSGDTRFLSPDSTFAEGKTFYSLINELENKWIADLNEKIYGKDGIVADITYWEKETQEAYDEIKATEYGISSLNIANYNVTKKGIKKRRKDQQKLVEMNGRLEYCQKKVKYHKEKKEKAITILNGYKLKLDQYKKLLGYNWVSWTKENTLFKFEDGATFDLYTQDFRFPPSESSESFEVRLLAVPYSALSSEADEVMLHLAISDVEPGFDRPIQFSQTDLFASNSHQLSGKLFLPEDSVAVLRFFELMLKKPNISIIARGQGVGEWNNGKISKMNPPVLENNYPGKTSEERNKSKQDSVYRNLRRSEIYVDSDEKTVTLEINAYTDPVRTDFEPKNEILKALIGAKKINRNDALSVYRTATLLKQFKLEMNIKSGKYLNRNDAKTVIDHLNKAIEKVKIAVGKTSVALHEL